MKEHMSGLENFNNMFQEKKIIISINMARNSCKKKTLKTAQ